MAINAKKVAGNGGGDRVEQPNIEPGVYPARLVQVIDLGVQPQRPYKGADKPPAQEIMLTYELVDEFMKDKNGDDVEDKPRWVSENFVLHNLKADLAKSTKRYLAFDPTEEYDGDWAKCVGQPINVTIVQNKNGDKIYDNVANLSAMRPKDAANCPELVNPTKLFDLDDPDMEVFAALPKWIQDKLTSNLNYKGSVLEEKVAKAPQEAPKEEKKEKVKKVREQAPPQDDDEDNPY
jgi:hypothetical protein